MVIGLGGPTVTHYVGLLSDIPAGIVSTVIVAVTSRHAPRGPLRTAWVLLAAALALYVIAISIGAVSWLNGRDPFPGPADIFYSAFYLSGTLAALFFIRAAAVKVPWVQLSLDATIFVVGFGAFFWFLVIRVAASASEVDLLKQAISLAYAALDCVLVLMLGVLLLARAGTEVSTAGRRVPVLLLGGIAAMFFSDVLWSLAKVKGYYLPGQFQDVLYLCWYVPMAAAGREHMRSAAGAARSLSTTSDMLARSLPYAAMLAAFLVLVYFSRGAIGGPATVMTVVVFALTLLFMVRQGITLRGDALARERKATRIVEDRYASLIANSSDVIMIVDADGTLRFVSPASERTLGSKPEDITGKVLPELWAGEAGDKLRTFLHRGRCQLLGHGGAGGAANRARHAALRHRGRRQQPHAGPGGAGPGAELPRHQRAQGARGAAAPARLPRPADAAGEPQPVPRPRAACAHAGAARAVLRRGHVPGPRQLQEHQ